MLDDVLDLIRFDLMPPVDLAASRQNATARQSPGFEARLLDAQDLSNGCGGGGAAARNAPRLLGKPTVVLPLDALPLGGVATRVSQPFVFRGQVLEVSAVRIVDMVSTPFRHGVKISLAADGGRAAPNFFAVPYIRSPDGRNTAVGRMIDGCDCVPHAARASLLPAFTSAAAKAAPGGGVAFHGSGGGGIAFSTAAPSSAATVPAAAQGRAGHNPFVFSSATLALCDRDGAGSATVWGGGSGGVPLVCVALVPRAPPPGRDSPLAWAPGDASVVLRAGAGGAAATAPLPNPFNAAFNWSGIT
jgi:hypothetical protein